MDVLMARQIRLALALLGATALACASSEEGSFSGGPGLSAGNGMSATEGSSTTAVSTSDASDATASGSNSNSNSNSGTSTTDPTTTDPATSDPATGTDTTEGTTEGTGTTGLDCDDGLGNLCGNPYDLGSIAEGEAVMSQTSTIITAGVADWFQVGFPAINRPGGGTPSISFLQNDDDAFRFDVFTGMPCGGEAASCGEGGDDNSQATNLDEYSYTDDQPDCCAPPDDSMVPWPGQLYIRVFRIDDGETCAAYQLSLSR